PLSDLGLSHRVFPGAGVPETAAAGQAPVLRRGDPDRPRRTTGRAGGAARYAVGSVAALPRGVVPAAPADDYHPLRPRRVGAGGRSGNGAAGRVGSGRAPSHPATVAGVHRANTGEGEPMNTPRDPAAELDQLLMALVDGELSPVQ